MGHLYWKLNVHEPNDIKHGRFPRAVFSRWSKVVLHMTTVRVGCITNSTQNIRYRKEEHFLKFNPQKWQITKPVKQKEKEKTKYVLTEICVCFCFVVGAFFFFFNSSGDTYFGCKNKVTIKKILLNYCDSTQYTLQVKSEVKERRAEKNSVHTVSHSSSPQFTWNSDK